MKRVIVITFWLLLYASCSKWDCTDYRALNYNADANHDDGSCRYLAEQFRGKYKGQDSALYFNSADTFFISWHSVSFQFSGGSNSRNTVWLTGLFEQLGGQYIGPTFEINDYNFSMIDSNRSPIRIADFSYVNDTLFYYYTSTYPDSSIHWGYGVKE